MRTVPKSTKQSNPGVKQAVILFPRPAPCSSNVANSTPTSYAPPLQTGLLPSTSSPYLSLTAGPQRSGSSFDMALLQYLRARMLRK
eukprot:11893765-Ditylum_brightwellii.AAC.1